MLNAAALTIAELRAARIDREEEMQVAYTALARNVHNVLLFGTRGAGKTFLTRLLEDDLNQGEPTLFACTANLASLGMYQPGSEEADAFPRAVLLQLCAAIWTRLLNKPYLQLKEHLSASGHEFNRVAPDEATVKAIYAQLMQHDLVHRSSRTNTAGMNLVAKGEMQEQFFLENKQLTILPFEFGEFVSQLLTDVLRPRGKEKIVVLCDEANHAKLYEQEQILERYFELFSSRRVQFLFVAAQGPWQEREYIPACFETTIQLNGFKNPQHVRTLVEADAMRRTGKQVRFTSEAIEVLVDVFSGHPRISLTASELALDMVPADLPRTIGLKEMLHACRITERRLKDYEKSLP